jgi:hypothetical protein
MIRSQAAPILQSAGPGNLEKMLKDNEIQIENKIED